MGVQENPLARYGHEDLELIPNTSRRPLAPAALVVGPVKAGTLLADSPQLQIDQQRTELPQNHGLDLSLLGLEDL